MSLPVQMSHRTQEIVVVSGLPRSGTSLMMQMLQAGGIPLLTDGVRPADDDNPKGYMEFEPVKQLRTDAAWLAMARGKAVKIIYLLLYHLPPQYTYRIVFLRRSLTEVLASQRSMLARRGEAVSDLPDAQLGQTFQEQLARLATWLSEQRNISVLDVGYNGLVSDPDAWADKVGCFLGRDLDTVAMTRAVDRTLYRNRQVGGGGDALV